MKELARGQELVDKKFSVGEKVICGQKSLPINWCTTKIEDEWRKMATKSSW